MKLRQLINNKKFLILLFVVAICLIAVIIVPPLVKKNNQTDRPLITEQEAIKSGKNVDEIKREMEHGSSQSVEFIGFDKLIDGNFIPHKLKITKDTIRQSIPTNNVFKLIDDSIQREQKTINYPGYSPVVFQKVSFDFQSGDKTYSVFTSFKADYDLFIVIKDGDKEIYSSPDS